MSTTLTPEATFAIDQRQSPAALIVLVLKTSFTLMKVFWPYLLIIFFSTSDEGSTSKSDKLAIMMLVLSAVSVAGALFRYWFYKFRIAEDTFIINTGWLIKKTTSIPLNNIIAVHLEQHLVHRVMQVAKVSLDSAGSNKLEVSIDALSLKKAELLKHLLLNKSTAHTDENQEQSIPLKQHRLTTKDLLVLSLTANHIEAFFILVALSINGWYDIQKVFKLDDSKWLEENAAILQSSLFITAFMIIAIALLSIVYSIIRTVLRFYDFTIITEPNGWRISYGLTTHQQKFIPFSRIQVLSWQTNFIRRKVNVWMMHISALGDSELKRKQRLHIPLTGLASAEALAGSYQQSTVFNPVKANNISQAYWLRTLLFVVLPVGLIPAVIAFYWLQWTVVFWLIIFIYLFIHSYIHTNVFRWQVNEEGLQLYSGVWGRKFTLVKWNKVQQVQLSQSMFQKKRSLANVKIVTAGGDVTIPFIDYGAANFITDQIMYKVESKNESWL